MFLRGRLAVTIALAGSVLAGCALLDGSSRLEEALEYLPADTVALTFLDRTAVTEPGPWTEAADLPFDETDVEWEASATTPAGAVRVWKLSDDVDFEALAGRLPEEGFAVIADEEVVVAGDDPTGLRRIASDRADSLADAETFADLLDRAGDQDGLEYAALALEGCPGSDLALLLPADGRARVVLPGDAGDAADADDGRGELVTAYLERSGPFACPASPDPVTPDA